jgi:hypothetical protein
MRAFRVGVMSAIVVVGVAGPALASPTMLAKVKEQGLPAQNCQYCHVSQMPKKEGFTTADLNERGKWLIAEKNKHKAKAVDLDALKAYPGGSAQK